MVKIFNHKTSTAPAPETKPTIAPSKPETVPTPRENPFSPSIEPETTPKG